MTAQEFADRLADLPLGVIGRTRSGGLQLVPLEESSLDHLFHALEHRARRAGLRVTRGVTSWNVNGFAAPCGRPIEALIPGPCAKPAGHAGPCRAFSMETRS